jgi:hypothetical protein
LQVPLASLPVHWMREYYVAWLALELQQHEVCLPMLLHLTPQEAITCYETLEVSDPFAQCSFVGRSAIKPARFDTHGPRVLQLPRFDFAPRISG